MSELTKQSQATVKQNNLRLCLKIISEYGPLSRAEIVRKTRISKPTISHLVEELMEKGIVQETGISKMGPGRKAALIEFNSRKKYFLAFEMGRAGYKIAYSDLKAQIACKTGGAFEPRDDIRKRIATLKKAMRSTMREAGLSVRDILKVICMAPGVFSQDGTSYRIFYGYETLHEEDLKREFSDFLPLELKLEHSTKLALFGEKCCGLARDRQNVVYIDFAYGLACSIMINGNMYFGPSNSAGEIGYFYSSIEEFRRARIEPFSFGMLENRISGKALAERVLKEARAKTPFLNAGPPGEDRVSAKTLFDAAKDGNKRARKILDESFSYFNMALANIVNLITPELVILGGGFSRAGGLLRDLIGDSLEGKVLRMPDILVSELTTDASVLGGLHYLRGCTDFISEL